MKIVLTRKEDMAISPHCWPGHADRKHRKCGSMPTGRGSCMTSCRLNRGEGCGGSRRGRHHRRFPRWPLSPGRCWWHRQPRLPGQPACHQPASRWPQVRGHHPAACCCCQGRQLSHCCCHHRPAADWMGQGGGTFFLLTPTMSPSEAAADGRQSTRLVNNPHIELKVEDKKDLKGFMSKRKNV